LAGAVVTLETERIKGSNSWCLWWWWWFWCMYRASCTVDYTDQQMHNIYIYIYMYINNIIYIVSTPPCFNAPTSSSGTPLRWCGCIETLKLTIYEILFFYILLLIYLSTAIGLTPGGSSYVYVVHLLVWRVNFLDRYEG
jgi:hypothetical protein